MGYSHYWKFFKGSKTAAETEKAYKKAILECQKVAKAYQKTATGNERLSGYTVNTKDGQYGGLNINGKGDEGCEMFMMREHFNQNESFGFCKTYQRPYDTVVVACLAILKYRLKDAFNVSSDGHHAEWNYGVELANKVLKRKIKNPIGLK